jgi:hypothetical protein
VNSAEFSSRMAEIRQAMEREEWTKAIHALENIGTIPDKFFAVVSNVLFYLYISRNQIEKLVPLSSQFDPSKSKHSVAALLLIRDKHLDYSFPLPADWDLEKWEKAIESHALAGVLEPAELQLCLYFLSILNRPRLLEVLHSLSIGAGGNLNDESIEIVLRCYLKNGWFEQARRFLWANNLNNIAFDRFDFLIDRAANAATVMPASTDKFLAFLRYKFGSHVPARLPHFAEAS